MEGLKLWIVISFLLFTTPKHTLLIGAHVPTTLEGPFWPVTRRFDPSLRKGSDDLPLDHPRLKKNVTGNFPEQIALALSLPTSMWVSWVTGVAQIGANVTALDPASVGSEVWYGKESGNYIRKKIGKSAVYSQLYPFVGLQNYTSGIIHHVRIDGTQYAWLKQDLEQVDRTTTPWLIAAWHPPWYNSYNSHYQEFECMRQQMEALLYQYRVDIIFSGHAHAYERMNRVYNYTLDPCGPIYITVGDGGNIEQIDIDHADDPGKCPSATDNAPEFGGVCHINFTSGPAKGHFCWKTQPEWSAFRESSFGHGILEVLNLTYALWTWHRNQDIYKNSGLGDQIYIVRQPDLCKCLKNFRSNCQFTANNNTGLGSDATDSARRLAKWMWISLLVVLASSI